MKHILLIFILVLLINNILYSNVKEDSIRVYSLGDISVTDVLSKSKISKSNINTINYHILQKTDVRSASELQLYIPSGRIRTNSRGESMLFLRGAGERQLGLFFDGVPLNVAWDNRFDLSMLPVDIIGRIDVNKNANSVMFGPNVLGGAVNISTIERSNQGIGGNARFQAGEAGIIQMSATNDGRIGDFNYIASFSRIKQDGITLSRNRPDGLLNQDPESYLRNNTDKEFSSLYARGEYDYEKRYKFGLSVLHINGEKGVGAETHIEETAARLWRFPDWDRTIITANGQFNLDESKNFVLRSTFWYDMFDQKTSTFSDITYKEILSSQTDKDKTAGMRLALIWNLANNQNITYVLNAFNTQHSEQIDKLEESLFSQNVVSSGLSYNWVGDLFSFRSGFVYDYIKTGDAGAFTDAKGSIFDDYGIFADFKYLFTDNIAIFANASRRTRFPTMREAYSGALDRFIVNPDLKPETGILTELGLSHTFEYFNFELAVFANFYDNLIEQVRLTAEQDPLRRRIRVNYANASIIGADFNFRITPINRMNIELNLTYMKAEGEQNGEKIDYIDNRPEFLLGLILHYKFNFGLNIQAEAEGVGKQFERNPDDQSQFVQIGGTTIYNLRIGYQLPLIQSILSEVFVRANNIFDTYRLSQLGLPESGRLITAGINFNL